MMIIIKFRKICIILLFVLITFNSIITYGKDLNGVTGIVWDTGMQVKMAIANNTDQNRIFTVGVGDYIAQKPAAKYISGVSVPAKTVVVKSLIVPGSITTGKSINIHPEYVFIKEYAEILSSIKIQRRENLNYGFSDFVIRSGNVGYFYILGAKDYKNGVETFYSVDNKYNVKGSSRTAELSFMGVNNLGLDYIDNNDNLVDVDNSTLIKILPKGAVFEFKTIDLDEAAVGLIDIIKVERDQGRKLESRINPPEFLIVGDDMEIVLH